MAIGSFRLPSGGGSASDWVRPSDWLSMPTVLDTEQKFVGLHAIFPDNPNYVAFRFTTSSGQYRVNWGDGTETLHNSNVNATKEYDYDTYDVGNTTLSSRGYKQVLITVTPVSGNLLTCNFQQRFTGFLSYSSGFLDCILSMPNHSASAANFGGATIRHSYVERFEVKTLGSCNSLSSFFNEFNALKSVPLFNTALVTTMSSMFNSCFSLQSVPLFNTASVTTMAAMFNSCYSLQSVPLFNTSLVTNMSSMFNSCFSLQSVPLFNTASVTTMSTMFNSCYSLQSVPLFNTASVTTMSTMFNICYALKKIPTFNTSSITTSSGTDFGSGFAGNCNSLTKCSMVFARTVGFGSTLLSVDAIVEIFTNLVDRTSTTAAAITISSALGAAGLSTAQRNIALNKNWTITG